MADDINSSVSRNARSNRRLEGYRIDASENRAISLGFSGNSCMVDVTLSIFTRGRSSDRISIGSPNESQGIGRGGIGVSYTEDELSVDGADSGIFTRDGRGTVVDALIGNESGMASLALGSGTTPVTYTDSSLESETVRDTGWRASPDGPTTTITKAFSTFEANDVQEVGVLDGEGALMCRLLVEDNPWKLGDDLIVEVELEFSSQTTGPGFITDVGLSALSDSIRSNEDVIGIDTMAIGTSNADPQPDDTSLDESISEKTVVRTQRSESVSVSTVWFEDEPAGHPHEIQEVGIFDNQDRLIWRTIIDPETKTDDLPVVADVGIRVI